MGKKDTTSCFLADEIKGKQIIGKKKKIKELGHTEQILQVSGSNTENHFVVIDSLGNFEVSTDLMLTLKGGYVYLKPMLNKAEYKPSIIVDEPFAKVDSLRSSCNSYSSYMNPSHAISKSPFDYQIASQDSSILLSEVTITGKKGKVFRDQMIGRLDSLSQMDVGGAWVCDCQTSIPFLNDYEPGFTHHPAGSPTGSYSGKRTKPQKGKRYELIKYEPKGRNGIWIVTKIKHHTWQGYDYTEEELLRMNNLWRVKGYYGKREFYQPDELDMQSPIPDARNVLLWKPNIVTDEKGEAEVEFFCSDINTNFIGVVEGTDGAGNLGTSQCEFKVWKPSKQ